jgi:hypothetical protein
MNSETASKKPLGWWESAKHLQGVMTRCAAEAHRARPLVGPNCGACLQHPHCQQHWALVQPSEFFVAVLFEHDAMTAFAFAVVFSTKHGKHVFKAFTFSVGTAHFSSLSECFLLHSSGRDLGDDVVETFCLLAFLAASSAQSPNSRIQS